MEDIIIDNRVTIPASAITFRYSRSGGKGGQNVNKVSTRVELIVLLSGIRSSEKVRALILSKLQKRTDSEGMLRIVAQESRSQWQNKQNAVEKLRQIIETASQQDPHRVATRPTRSSKAARVNSKKKAGERKILRRKLSRTDPDE